MKTFNKKNKTMITLITSSSIFKIAFGYSFGLTLTASLEQVIGTGDFFTKALEAVPSKIIVVIGVIYGIALLAKQLSSTWKSWQMDRLTVRKEKEFLEQQEIETEKQRKNLEI